MIPTLEEFLEHGYEGLEFLGEDPKRYIKSLKAKYLSWKQNGWKTGKGRKIKNWRSTLTNTLIYLKAENIEVNEPKLITVDFKKYG